MDRTDETVADLTRSSFSAIVYRGRGGRYGPLPTARVVKPLASICRDAIYQILDAMLTIAAP